MASADTVPAQKAPSKDALKSALSATLRKRQAGQVKEKESARLSGRPKIVTARGEVKSFEIRDLFPRVSDSAPAAEIPRATEPEEVESPSSDALPQQDALAHVDEVGKAIEDLPQAAIPDEGTEEEALQAGVQDSLSLETVQADATEQEPKQARPATVPVAHETKAQEEAAPVSDEALAEKIEAFEFELAMSCPVCGTGRIQPKETAKGKTFYVCSLPGCIFVSWGKPYHLECPRCKNPFLVEFAGKGGETILKCPRATCRYQQPIPEEAGDVLAQPLAPGLEKQRRFVAASSLSVSPKKRKVVRRRVVRKKR